MTSIPPKATGTPSSGKAQAYADSHRGERRRTRPDTRRHRGERRRRHVLVTFVAVSRLPGPLLYFAGLAGDSGAKSDVLVDGYAYGSLSMTAYTLDVTCPAGTDTEPAAPLRYEYA